MAYASIPDLRKSLPKQVTIGDNTLSTPDVVQTQGAPNTISNASALYYLDLATQHINGRLETLYFTPLRRIKQLEVLLTQNVAAGGDIIYVPDGSAFNVGCLIRIGDGNHTETHFIKEAWPTDPARMGQLKLDLPLQNAYVATAPTMVSEIVYPAPIPVCCARIAAAAIIDKVFVTEKAPDVPTGYGKSMRTLANNDLDAILNGAMRLVGQDYNGRRFVRVTNFDTIKSTSQFPPGQGKEI